MKMCEKSFDWQIMSRPDLAKLGKLKLHNWAMAFIIILIYYYIIYI